MTRLYLLLALLLTASACASAPSRPTTTGSPPSGPVGVDVSERIVAKGVPVLEGIPHAVKSGLTVQIGGMVPIDSAGRLIAPGNLTGQVRQTLKNLAAVVQAAHGVPGDVVQLTVYLRNPSPDAVLTVRNAVLEALGKDTAPALVFVGTTGLPEAAMEVMISGMAQLRSEFPDRLRMGPGRGNQ